MRRAAPATSAASATLRARLVAGLALFVAPGLAGATGNEASAVALRTSQAALGRVTSDHVFIDQDGQPLRLAGLRGRPLVVSLVFTNCYAVCSGATLNLREVVRIARETLGERSFGVLTVGFDSANDTPQRMRAYGRDRGIVDPQWHFASADAATIRRFTDEIGFTWAPSPRGFDHLTQVTLLDADGRVVQQVYGEAFAPPELVEPLKRLLLGRSIERASVRGLIERVRLYCSVYDPAARRYRIDASMFAAALPPLLVLGIVAGAIVVSGRRRKP
ncbi:MAG TPA: SCO family protein [Steroidobacteraceae bacterium]|nr:SCO family protein [Steroidobacteraceae bacterium]